MSYTRNKSWYVGIGFILAVFWTMCIAVQAVAAPPPPPAPPPRHFQDLRYHHNHVYPAPNVTVNALPRGYHGVVHNGVHFYFAGGVWYRAKGPRYIVVRPPIGLFVPFLPPFYSTIWVLGVPYYYANEVYYMNRGDGYVIVDPPKEEVSETPPPSGQMFIYPRQGQSEKQQADDRFTCHRWAVDKTGYDPTKPSEATEHQKTADRADYQRAMTACLEGKGYTVK